MWMVERGHPQAWQFIPPRGVEKMRGSGSRVVENPWIVPQATRRPEGLGGATPRQHIA